MGKRLDKRTAVDWLEDQLIRPHGKAPHGAHITLEYGPDGIFGAVVPGCLTGAGRSLWEAIQRAANQEIK